MDDGHLYPASVEIELTLVLGNDGSAVQSFHVDNVVVDVHVHPDSGLFGFWKKVKRAAKKVVKATTTIVGDAAKAALKTKAAEVATKVVGSVVG